VDDFQDSFVVVLELGNLSYFLSKNFISFAAQKNDLPNKGIEITGRPPQRIGRYHQDEIFITNFQHKKLPTSHVIGK
jgi:hypothetical protein